MVSDLINDLFPHALDCGIAPERFWELSIPDILDIVESHQRREERNFKLNLTNLHFLAQDIGQYTALAIQGSDNVKIMELWDCFPDLFAEKKDAIEEERKKQQMEVYKAQMTDFAYRHNHAMEGGES